MAPVSDNSEFDIAIIGGGAAGLTAGIHASRRGLSTMLLEQMMTGGQVINAEAIENFPGFPNGISGFELGPLMQEQAMNNGMEINLTTVTNIVENDSLWKLTTSDGTIKARAVIIAGGSSLRKLGVPGEVELHGSGVSYCASCDGGFFSNETVGVVGNGDSALDETVVLTEFASHVILFCLDEHLRGQKVLQDRVLQHPKVTVSWNTKVESILGKDQVEGVNVRNILSGETSRVDLSALFIYVGLDPNTDYLAPLLPLDNAGHIPTDSWMRTDLPGILAAGDIRQHSAAQLITAAGDGATAAVAAHRYIENGAWVK